MAFDFKKEYKDYYVTNNKPNIIVIPKMNYIAVKGKGNPNDENGEYKKSIELLYGIAYTIKMSKKNNHVIDGFFDYVVPPLEGLWWQEGNDSSIDYNKKDEFCFISIIRLPDFVTIDDFNWAIKEATIKKKRDYSKVEFMEYNEGLCIQCQHIGTYDEEPKTINKMHEYMSEFGYELDINNKRFHHEIYLNDPRKCDPSKIKVVIRHPIKIK